jgi:hypothetical protein
MQFNGAGGPQQDSHCILAAAEFIGSERVYD